jgi:NADPH-dependent curcumin reductase CurA
LFRLLAMASTRKTEESSNAAPPQRSLPVPNSTIKETLTCPTHDPQPTYRPGLPPGGAPTPENFRLERVAFELAEGEVLLKTLYLSLDPYMRGRMSDAPSYAAPVEIGGVMTGGAVSRSSVRVNPKFQEGDLVVGATGWQSHSISDGRNIMPVPSGLPSPSMALACWACRA